VPRTQDSADLARVIRRAEVGAQAPSGVAGAPRIERFLSNSNLESPVETALHQTALYCRLLRPLSSALSKWDVVLAGSVRLSMALLE